MNSRNLLTLIKGDSLSAVNGYRHVFTLLDPILDNVETGDREISAEEKAMILGALVWCVFGFVGGALLLTLRAWELLHFNDLHEGGEIE